ncbi:hypothetical protein HORIV_70720 [Vreelandella olivaria]|uniref:AraC-type arabinose-binding/dimerisation domain-containing protein n=1 Tax=Vreelandella olivaria TaxID=390919 RepID=A0ABM7GSP1_9GAMM|nr:hypothetical protein HORIV_70720 [Halomonas olivaria]
MMPASSATSVPVFKLYGETQHWPTPDLLHCESIPERSQLHDWRIRPHRHADLVHILFISHGSVELELEGTSHQLQSPSTIVVPAMAIHGFLFSPDVEGHIITLAKPLADHLHALMGENSTLKKLTSIRCSSQTRPTELPRWWPRSTRSTASPPPGATAYSKHLPKSW